MSAEPGVRDEDLDRTRSLLLGISNDLSDSRAAVLRQACAQLAYFQATRAKAALQRPTPLTDAQVLDFLPGVQSGWSLETYGLWVARAIERAHGIVMKEGKA